MALSEDHVPQRPAERARIEAAGGVVRRGEVPGGGEQGPWRVYCAEGGPGLAMSRSIGDCAAHGVGVAHAPDITQREICREDRVLLLATDGVWDMLTNLEAVRIIAAVSRGCTQDPQGACGKLCAVARRAWERREARIDDVSCVLVLLPHHRAETLRAQAAQQRAPPAPAPAPAVVAPAPAPAPDYTEIPASEVGPAPTPLLQAARPPPPPLAPPPPPAPGLAAPACPHRKR